MELQQVSARGCIDVIHCKEQLLLRVTAYFIPHAPLLLHCCCMYSYRSPVRDLHKFDSSACQSGWPESAA